MTNEIIVSIEKEKTDVISAELTSIDSQDISVELEKAVDYEKVSNKPQINGVELVGDKTTEELGIDIPEVPKVVSAFENDSGYLTEHQDISHLATKEELPIVPTNVSAFENDSGYLTEHQDISHLAEKKDIEELSEQAAGIEEKIPSTATASNQLTDRDFVNSSISTATATFKGTYNSLEELQAVSADNNDYGFVVSKDLEGNTVYNRYKYNGSGWVFEYALNNSSFTADQWASINSGATESNISQIKTNKDNITNLGNQLTRVEQTISGKADKSDTYTKAEVDEAVNSIDLSEYAKKEYISDFRGNWANYTSVPENSNNYPLYEYNSRIPTFNDYLIVKDAGDYFVSSSKNLLEADVAAVNVYNTPAGSVLVNFNAWYMGVAYNGYMGSNVPIGSFSSDKGKISFKSASSDSYGVCKFVQLSPNTTYTLSSKSGGRMAVTGMSDEGAGYYKFSSYIKTPTSLPLTFTTREQSVVAIIFYASSNQEEVVYDEIQLEVGSSATSYETAGGYYLSGAWRFRYSGEWSVNGKLGWIPEYELDNTSLNNYLGHKINNVVVSNNSINLSPENFLIYKTSQPSEQSLSVNFDMSSIEFDNNMMVWEVWIDFAPYYVENSYEYIDALDSNTSKTLTQRDYTAPSVIWDDKIIWVGGEPELTVYGQYKFRFTSSEKGVIYAEQIYPTPIRWVNQVTKAGYTYSVNAGTATSVDAVKPYYGNGNTVVKIRYASYNSSWSGNNNMIINYYRQPYNGSIGAVDELFCLGKTRSGTRLLIKPNYTMENFNFNLGANVKGYLFKQVDSESNVSIWACDVEKRQANELENIAYKEGWRG